jgi:hypothetical protein
LKERRAAFCRRRFSSVLFFRQEESLKKLAAFAGSVRYSLAATITYR